MPRILFVTDFFQPEPGGLELLFTSLVRHFPQGEIDVIITSSENQGFYTPSQLYEFDRLQKFSIHRIPVTRHDIFQRPQERIINIIEDVICQNSYNHILLGNISSATIAASIAAKNHDKPYALILNGSDIRNSFNWMHGHHRRALFDASVIFTLSTDIARAVIKRGAPVSHVISLPPVFEPQWNKSTGILSAELREKLKDRFVILAVGPLIPRKGLDLVVKMQNYLGDLRDRIHIVIAGSGPEYHYLNSIIRGQSLQNTITLTGFVDNETLGGLYARAQVMIQPGKEREEDLEGMSMALMESSWFGLPVVAGAIGAVTDIVVDGKTGYLIEPDNAVQAADRIRHLYMNPDILRRMSRQSRLRADTTFSVKQAAAIIRNSIRERLKN